MNATGFDANTIEEGPEPNGGVDLTPFLSIVNRGFLRSTAPSVLTSLMRPAREVGTLYSQLVLVRRRASERRLREFERWRASWEKMSAALDAYYEGNETVFWEWVEKHIEHAPDGLLREDFARRMPRTSKELYPHAFLHHLKHHKRRLGIIEDPVRLDQIRSEIKLFGSLRRALDTLCADGSETTREQMLDQMIQFTLHSELDKSSPPGSDPDKQLVNEVSNLIRRQARLERNSFPELSEFLGDPDALAPYDAVDEKLLREWPCNLAWHRLTPREFEVLEMTLDNQRQSEIAAHLSITEGRVSQLLDQVRQKLADIA
jgi:DNA-binding NarL/FixJ family response regulator